MSILLFSEEIHEEPLGEQIACVIERQSLMHCCRRTRVVKHADEAANAHQIFIGAGEAVQLVKEDEIEGAGAIVSYSLSSPSL